MTIIKIDSLFNLYPEIDKDIKDVIWLGVEVRDGRPFKVVFLPTEINIWFDLSKFVFEPKETTIWSKDVNLDIAIGFGITISSYYLLYNKPEMFYPWPRVLKPWQEYMFDKLSYDRHMSMYNYFDALIETVAWKPMVTLLQQVNLFWSTYGSFTPTETVPDITQLWLKEMSIFTYSGYNLTKNNELTDIFKSDRTDSTWIDLCKSEYYDDKIVNVKARPIDMKINKAVANVDEISDRSDRRSDRSEISDRSDRRSDRSEISDRSDRRSDRSEISDRSDRRSDRSEISDRSDRRSHRSEISDRSDRSEISDRSDVSDLIYRQTNKRCDTVYCDYTSSCYCQDAEVVDEVLQSACMRLFRDLEYAIEELDSTRISSIREIERIRQDVVRQIQAFARQLEYTVDKHKEDMDKYLKCEYARAGSWLTSKAEDAFFKYKRLMNRKRR